MDNRIWLYILVMGAASFAIRALPLTLLRRQIKSRFLQSFLYYVPYVTLSLMTFPAIIHATQSPISGWCALAVGVITAWLGADLFKVALSCCGIVLVVEYLLPFIG